MGNAMAMTKTTKDDNPSLLDLICDPKTDLVQLAKNAEMKEWFKCDICSDKFMMKDYLNAGLQREDFLRSDECPKCYKKLLKDATSIYNRLDAACARDNDKEVEKIIQDEVNKLTPEQQQDAFEKIKEVRTVIEQTMQKGEDITEEESNEALDHIKREMKFMKLHDLMKVPNILDYDDKEEDDDQVPKSFKKLQQDIINAESYDTKIECTLGDLMRLMGVKYEQEEQEDG